MRLPLIHLSAPVIIHKFLLIDSQLLVRIDGYHHFTWEEVEVGGGGGGGGGRRGEKGGEGGRRGEKGGEGGRRGEKGGEGGGGGGGGEGRRRGKVGGGGSIYTEGICILYILHHKKIFHSKLIHLPNSTIVLITYIRVYFPLLESKLQVLHKRLLCEFVQENEVRLPVLWRAKCSHGARSGKTLRLLVLVSQ